MKNYTDIGQSKKLKKILPIESADGGWYGTNDPFAANTTFWLHTKYSNKAVFPAWSLVALLDILPSGYVIVKNYHNFYYVESRDHKKSTNIFNNPIDACVEMILKLYDLNLL